MLHTGISVETGNPVTGFLIKDSNDVAYILPEDKVMVRNGKLINQLVAVEPFSDKGITPYVDAVGYPICIGDVMQIKTGQIGVIEVRNDLLVFVTEDDLDFGELYYHLTETFIMREGAQVIGDKWHHIKDFKDGYARPVY